MRDFMNKALAAVGVDGVQVDAKLDRDRVRIGEDITGRLEVKGGRAAQEIRGLSAVLACDVMEKRNDNTFVGSAGLSQVNLREGFTIEPGQTVTVDFSMPVPVGAPVDVPHRKSKASVYVLSAADVALARDPQDLDRVSVTPTRLHDDVRAVMDDLGFRFREGEVERTRHGIVQEFEFVPARRGSRFDEVEVAFIPNGNDYVLVVETDLSAGTGLGFMSAVLDMDLDERKHTFRLSGGPDGPGRDTVARAIRQCLNM